MSAKSTLAGMSRELRTKTFDYLKQNGIKRPDYNRLSLYISREAQQDNNPSVTWEEAAKAIDAYMAKAPLTRLPGPDKDFTFVLEDGTNTWGVPDFVSPEAWKEYLSDQANLVGVEVEFELVPGSKKEPSFWDKMAGIPGTAKYTVTLSGDKDAVERVVDLYHQRKYAKDSEGE